MESKPAIRIAGGFLKGLPPAAQRTTPAPIKLVFLLADRSKIKYGKRFDYTLTVTNETAHDIKLPRSLVWSDVADVNKKEQTYEVSRLIFELHAPTSTTALPGGITLYGSVERPSTIVDLKPGESFRILGDTMMFPRVWTPPLPKGKVEVAIRASLEVELVYLHTNEDGYQHDATQIYNEKSENKVEFEYQSPAWWTPEPISPGPKESDVKTPMR